MLLAENTRLPVNFDREDSSVGASRQLFGVGVLAVRAARVVRKREETEIGVTGNGCRKSLARLGADLRPQACFATAEQTALRDGRHCEIRFSGGVDVLTLER